MADVQSLASLDPVVVQNNAAFLQAMLQDAFPTMDLTASTVFNQLVQRPAATLYTLNETNLALDLASRSLQAINANPAAADPTSVDEVLSNYNINRLQGGMAIGTVTIIAPTNNVLVIPTSMVFTANGVNYLPTSTYTGVPDSSSVVDTSTDVIFTARADGSYSINIQLLAQTNGSAGNVSQGTQFTVTPVTDYIDSVLASGDFSGGADVETTPAMLTRLVNGLAASNGGGRLSVAGWIKNTYPTVADISLIGTGDPEMTRGSHNLLAVKAPGFCDIYLRTRSQPAVVQIQQTVTLQDKVNQLWSFSLSRDTYPGLYQVQVLPLSTNVLGSLPITALTRVIDPSYPPNLDFTPSLPTTAEGVFTRYQNVQVVFQDANTPTAAMTDGVTTATYTIIVTYMGPELATISDWLENRSRRPPGDYLVKAPIPCFVAVGMKIVVGNGDTTPSAATIQAIQNAVATAINATDFATGRLDAASIADAAQSVITGTRTRVQLPLDLRGQVLFPDNTSGWLFSPQDDELCHALVAPNNPNNVMCSPRTMAFYGDSSRVSVSVVTTSAPPV